MAKKTFKGGNGNDTLSGTSDADILIGGRGNDTYIVNNAGDEVIEKDREGTDTVQSYITYTLTSYVENLALIGVAAINGTGNSLDNTITGNGAANVLDGGAGADRMAGGGGNDTYIVDDYDDVVIESLNQGMDTVLSSVSYALAANVENLTLTGPAVIGAGNALDNVIVGGASLNILVGRGGNDTLTGGGGLDYIDGGTGTDTAVYSGSYFDYRLTPLDINLPFPGCDWNTEPGGGNDNHTGVFRIGVLVLDQRTGSPDGLDLVRNVEDLRFSDVVIHIDGRNNAPLGAPTAVLAGGTEDVPYSVSAASLLAGFVDPDGDTLAVSNLTADHGTVAASGSTFVVTPAANYYGPVTLGYDVVDGRGGSVTATRTFTLAPVNDAPVAAPDAGNASEAGGVHNGTPGAGASGNVLTNDSDVEGDALAVIGVAAGAQAGPLSGGVATSVTGVYGALALGANGAWTYAPDQNDADTQALAQGESRDDVFSYTVSDGHGGSATTTLTLHVAGANDAPDITGGAATGAVKEDVNATTTGQLTVFDPDHNATQSWTVSGGSASGNADYHFRADSFTVTRNNALLFNDDFNDGNPPPSAPNFANGNPTTYGGIGGFGEAGGKLLIDSGNATSFVGAGTPDPIIGQDIILRSNIDPANLGAGLKSNANFSIMAVFDLVLPDSPREAYGIRATDRLVGGQGTPPDQPGDDAIELAVLQNAAGVLRVALREVDFANDQNITIQSLALNAPVGADQIRLRLDHSTTDVGALHASFEYLSGGVTIVGSQQTFSQVGRIFGTETPGYTGDDENWTRAALLARAPALNDSTLSGQYGTLNVNQAGMWTYTLDNSRTVTQNLAEGQTASDTFTVAVTDEHGASDTETVNITVTGTNDAPIAQTPAVTRTLGEDTASPDLTASGLMQFGDVDLNDTHTVVVSLQPPTLSDGSPVPGALVAAAGGALQGILTDPSTGDGHGGVQWSFALANSQAQFLAANQTLTLTYQLAVTDNFGASAAQSITVNVTGMNDAPSITGGDTSGAVQEAPNNSPDEQANVVREDTGAIAFADVDLADTHSATFQAQGAGYLGAFTLLPVDQSGDTVGWKFSVADAALDALTDGETRTQDYLVTVDDGHGGTASDTVSVTITGAADVQAPVASDDSRATDESHVLDAAVPPAVDADGTVVSYTLVSDVAQGVLTFNADGTYTFDPAGQFGDLSANQHAQVTFTYYATDNDGANSNVGTVTIDISGLDDAPSVVADVGLQYVSINAAYSFTLPPGLFAGFGLTGPVSIAVTTTAGGLPGWLGYDAGTGTLSGTPASDDAGLVQLVLTASDTSGGSGALFLPLTVLDGATIDGLAGDDAYSGTSAGDHMRGFGGNDLLFAGLGADLVEGGDGNDDLRGEAGDDVMDGGQGGDSLAGGAGDDVLFGRGDSDSLQGGAGNDHLEGGAGGDSLEDTDGGRDVLNGGDDADTLFSQDISFLGQAPGADLLDGGGGDDNLYREAYGNGVFGSTLLGGDGNDTIHLLLSDFGVVAATAVVDGGAGNDDIVLFDVNGSAAHQLLIDGGDGDDTVSVGSVTVQMTALLGDGNDSIGNVGMGVGHSVDAGAGDDAVGLFLDNAVTLTLGSGADAVTVDHWGGASAVTVSDFAVAEDTLDVTAVLDALEGWDGGSNPFATGYMRVMQEGADALFQVDLDGGGDGYVTLARLQGVDYSLLTAQNLVSGFEPDGTAPVGVVIDGDAANNTLIGTNADDTLRGYGGDDTLIGQAGADVLEGGDGNDAAQGGAGNDSLDGGAGGDTLQDVGGGSDTLVGGDDGDSLYSQDVPWLAQALGADLLDGGGGNDTLYREAYGDGVFGSSLLGGDGNDTIELHLSDFDGLSATAVVDGGAGNDDIQIIDVNGSAGKHLLVDSGGGDDTVYLGSVTVQMTALLGAGNDSIGNVGLGLGHSVDAGAGDDVVRLWLDNAVTLALGAGADQVVFDHWNGASAVTLSDFGVAEDTLDITAVLDALTGWDGGSNPFAAGYMRLVQQGADTLFEVDLNGGGDSYTTLALLEGVDHSSLTAQNLVPAYDPNGAAPVGVAIDGDAGDNTLIGTNADDTLRGFDGDDTLTGQAGADVLEGGNGNDVVQGGAGNDHLDGAAGGDTLQDVNGGSDVLVGGDDGDFLYSQDVPWLGQVLGADLLDGGAGDDDLYREAYGDGVFGSTLLGGDGDDTLQLRQSDFGAAAATAVVDGGAGNDNIYLVDASGSANKQLQVDSGTGDDVVSLGNVTVQTSVHLGDGDDYIANVGVGAGQSVDAGAGADVLHLALYNDVAVTLGSDADTVLVDVWNGASAAVTDFATTQDVLDIHQTLTGYNGDAASFVKLAASGSATVLSVDVDGGADNFVELAVLQNVTYTGTLLTEMVDSGHLVLA